MRTISLSLFVLTLVSATAARALEAAPPAPAAAAPPADGAGAAAAPSREEERAWRLQASYDLGVLSFGGIGLHAGVAHGPWAANAGFYRFESKNLFGGALGGFPDEFALHVDFILAAQVGYYFNGEANDGFYGKLIYQLKQQTVTHEASGETAVLSSQLLGPEVGYEWDFFAGLFLRPRLGVLLYVDSPQPGRRPVNIAGAEYDNPTHNWVDAYITADLGYEFDL
jgi:hypothetical protein